MGRQSSPALEQFLGCLILPVPPPPGARAAFPNEGGHPRLTKCPHHPSSGPGTQGWGADSEPHPVTQPAHSTPSLSLSSLLSGGPSQQECHLAASCWRPGRGHWPGGGGGCRPWEPCPLQSGGTWGAGHWRFRVVAVVICVVQRETGVGSWLHVSHSRPWSPS